MSFLGKVNCGKQSVFAKETLGHNLQLPEGNAKSAQKTKGWEQMRMSLSICLLGRKGWLHVPLTSSGFRYRPRHNGKVGPFCFSRWQSCALGLISKHSVTHDIGTYGELFGDKRSIFLPTSEYSILWTCFLHSTTRQWILFGESGAVVDRCVEDPVLVKIQRQRWRNVWLYPRMYIWF